ncbi:MAG: NUDIX domain-containing protein [Candidatus Shapirobacteria bacterium]|jgi:8-oxo-dGTP diphosphatase
MDTEECQKVSVAGLLILNGKALVVRRSGKETFLPGVYEIPGGKVEFGEKPNQSIIREFQEEVNLKIKPLIPFRVFDYISKEGKRQTIEIVYLVELDNDTANNLKLSDAHDKYEWVGKDYISELNLSDEIRLDLEDGFRIFFQVFHH